MLTSRVTVCLCLPLFLQPHLFAQDSTADAIARELAAQDVAEEQFWVGTLKIDETRSLRLGVRLTPTPEGMQGVLLSPEQGPEEAAFDSLTHEDNLVTFRIEKNDVTFRGELSEDGLTVTGTFTQRGQTLPLTLSRVESLEDKLVEAWSGVLDAGGLSLKLQFRVLARPEGTTVVKFDSLTERVTDLPASMSVQDDQLALGVPRLMARFEGTINPAGTVAIGKWIQGGASFDMTMEKTADAEAPPKRRRPQTPRSALLYESQEVEFENKTDNLTLAGTLTLPPAGERFPAAILISGSGPQDRDETLFEHKPFLVIADDLTTAGVAVLRFDDRGIGGSTGNFATATSADFANDVRAAVAFLREHPAIDPNRIGLIGHSEGGLIAPMVAAADPDIAFIVMMAGPGVPGIEILREQSTRIARTAGLSEDLISASSDLREIVAAALAAAPDDAQLSDVVKQAVDSYVSSLPEDRRNTFTEAQRSQYQRLATPWFRYFLEYDPRPTLSKVKCPVLALNGELDLQVWHEQNLPEIAGALRAGGNSQFRAVRLPKLNHLFQRATTGSPQEYAEIEDTMAPVALDLMRRWILDTVE